ncbi:Venom allergen 3, partial [Gryllus bimaculatus]
MSTQDSVMTVANAFLSQAWDEEVASVAQRWADQCNYSHDSCRNVPDTYVGQNIYQRSQYPVSAMNDRGNWSEPIYAWYDEVALMAASQVSSYQNREDIGHYTQTVWASTNRIGCGYTFYQDGDWGKKYYVCNYAPGGNYVGQPLYQVGSPRSACPASSGDTGTPDPAYPG